MTGKKDIEKQDGMDFEIKFFEAVLQKRPHFIEALVALGDLYTKKGLYEKGLTVDEKLTKLRPHDPVILYNLACSHSLLNDIEKSLKTIKLAIELGYDDFEYLEYDSDLKNLRQDSRFQEFFYKIRKTTTENK